MLSIVSSVEKMVVNASIAFAIWHIAKEKCTEYYITIKTVFKISDLKDNI